MKKTLTLSLILAAGTAAQATLLTVTNWDGNNTGTYQTVWTVLAAADGNDVVYSWSRTGNLDGLGGAADTLTFDLRHEAFTGSSFTSPDVTLGSSFDLGGATAQHFGPGGDLDNNQSFRLSIENIVYTQGADAGPDTWAATFDGFSDYGKFISEAETVYVGTTNAEAVGDAGVTFTGPLQVLTTSMIGSDANNRFRDLDFSFTTAIVPEPSTLAMLCIGAALLGLRRNRSQRSIAQNLRTKLKT